MAPHGTDDSRATWLARRPVRAFLAAAIALTGCELAFPADHLSSEGASAVGGAGGAAGSSAGSGLGGVATGGESAGPSCACLPGETQLAPCGHCGEQLRVCGEDCTWGLFGECGHEGVCAPGDTSSATCGNCGTKTRTCSSQCTWNDYGACGSEGVCAPGDTSSAPCGNCGTKTRTCSMSCAWGDYGACGGEGECSPGSTEGGCAEPCDAKVCGNDCHWGGCGLAPGKVCEWDTGHNHRCCGSGKWQYCDSQTCNWFPCADCNGCGC